MAVCKRFPVPCKKPQAIYHGWQLEFPRRNTSGTPKSSSIRKPSKAGRPKSSKGSVSVENGGTSGNGKIRLCPSLRLSQRLASAAITRALVEAAASSRSAAAGDCYPRRTRAGQVAFKSLVALVISGRAAPARTHRRGAHRAPPQAAGGPPPKEGHLAQGSPQVRGTPQKLDAAVFRNLGQVARRAAHPGGVRRKGAAV